MIPDGDIIKEVSAILAPILEEYSIQLVEIEFKPSGKRWLLRIYIDKEGGVTIADCEKVNRELGTLLDVEDVIQHPYKLEVSSPGLTRALKGIEDFARYRGKSCRIITGDQIDGKNEFRGEIVEAKEDKVSLRGKMNVFIIPICAIKKANLELEP